MTQNLKCSKCNGEMQEGLVVDFGYTGILQSMWVGGESEKGFLTGAQTNGKRKAKTITYRCPDCGYLDAYAR